MVHIYYASHNSKPKICCKLTAILTICSSPHCQTSLDTAYHPSCNVEETEKTLIETVSHRHKPRTPKNP